MNFNYLIIIGFLKLSDFLFYNGRKLDAPYLIKADIPT